MTLAPELNRPARRPAVLLVATVLALLAAAKGSVYGSMDPDWFWHVRVGAQLLEQGIGPLVDHISYGSMREPWTPYSWLAELFMKAIWDIGGLPATVFAQALFMGGFVYLIALCCREGARSAAPGDSTTHARPGPAGVVVTAVLFTFLVLPYLSLRPVTMTLIPMALSAWLLLRDRRYGERTRAVWWLVPLVALSINFHFYAILIPVWCGALMIGAIVERIRLKDERAETNRRLKRYIALTVLGGAACMATPMPFGTIKSVFHYALADQMVAAQVITEMRPLWTGSTGIVNSILLLVMMAFIFARRKDFRIGEWIWLILCLVLAIRLGRCVVLLALIGGPMLSSAMRWKGTILERRHFRSVLAVLISALLLRVTLAIPTPGTDLDVWLDRHGTGAYPCAAAGFVDEFVPVRAGRIINEFTWGGYLSWRLAPKYQTLLDGRTQVFEPRFWQSTYLGTPDDQKQVLTRSPADAAVLPVANSRFASVLRDLGWREAYSDGTAMVLLPPAHNALVEMPIE